jgi:signal transduction histidine kinase
MPTLRLDLYLVGVAVAASIILGFVIFYQNRKSITNILFLIFTLVSSIWSVVNYISYYAEDPFWTLLMVRLVMLFAVLQALSFFLLVFAFPKDRLKLPKFISIFVIPLVVGTAILTLTPFVFSGVRLPAGRAPEPIPAPGIALFAIVAISLVASGIYLMIKRMRSADQKLRMQFKYLLIGLLVMFFLIILCNFILAALLGISNFVPLGAVFIFPFIVFTSYAIARHELLNIRIVGTEILTFVLIIVTFIEVVLSSTLGEILFRSGVFIGLVVFGILLVRSVVREVKQREKLAELNEKLKALDKQKDEFVSMAAHELRSPLTAIKGYVSMVVEGDTGDIPEKAREFLADTGAVTDRLIRLVNNMLNVSRIEEGRIVYQMEVTNIIRAVQEIYFSFRIEAERKGIEITLDAPDGLKDEVYVDPDRVREVISNIVSNAVKFTEKGKIEIRISNPKESSVKVEVIDSGPGISKEEQQKLFQKFYRAESTSGKTFGTGLGLYITRLLVEKFGGKIGLISKPGKGSNFWFELPISKKV